MLDYQIPSSLVKANPAAWRRIRADSLRINLDTATPDQLREYSRLVSGASDKTIMSQIKGCDGIFIYSTFSTGGIR